MSDSRARSVALRMAKANEQAARQRAIRLFEELHEFVDQSLRGLVHGPDGCHDAVSVDDLDEITARVREAAAAHAHEYAALAELERLAK